MLRCRSTKTPQADVIRAHDLSQSKRSRAIQAADTLNDFVDADLAQFYGVPTKRLNEQVKRNKARFPKDFMFQLSAREKSELVANCDHLENLKYSQSLPFVFTEHGAIMAASVLNSQKAIEASVFIVRAFVRIRRVIAEHKEISRRIVQIENRLADHDEQIIELIKAIKQLLKPDLPPKKRRIGFHAGKH